MASMGTVENVDFLKGMGVLKNAIFCNNGRRPNRTRYSSMNDRIATGIWSPFLSTTSPSYHTSHRYLWKVIAEAQICLSSAAPPPKKRGCLMKHTPPLKYFITFDRTHWNPISGFRIWASLSSKWLKPKKSDEPFFRNCTYDFWIILSWFSLKGPIWSFCFRSIMAQWGPNFET